MNKKILVSVMVIAVACALVGGGIYAYFSDTETSEGSTFTAGTLNLVPSTSGTGPAGKYTVTEGGDGVNGKVVFTTLAPEDSGSITWELENDGDLDGTLTMASDVIFDENGSNEPEDAVAGNNGGGDGDLDEYMGVRLERDGTYILGTASHYVPFSDLEVVLDAESESLAASDTLTYVLEWEIASDVMGAADDVDEDDNIIQSDKATLDITFTLTQA